MENYFNINYEFDRQEVLTHIDRVLSENGKGYICVADGVILNIANRNKEYLKVINSSLFSICDSSWVPLYIRLIYGFKRVQYCGAQIFCDIIKSQKYRMIFMGTNQSILNGLKDNISKLYNPECENMTFYELPFNDVEDFDYQAIAKIIEDDKADIIWVALGAPKQEYFMYRLNSFLKKGVQIAVGAAFKFFSGTEESRAPQWMIKYHLEFIYRIFQDPKKQIKRCLWIVWTLPKLFISELLRKYRNSPLPRS